MLVFEVLPFPPTTYSWSYCIIQFISVFSPDRLPYYLRVFSKAASEQVYRYADVPLPDDDVIKTEGQNGQGLNAEAAKKEDDQGQGQASHSHGQGQPGHGQGQPGHDQGQGQPEAAGMAPTAEQERSRPQKTRLTEDEVTRIHNLDCVGVTLKPQYGMVGLRIRSRLRSNM